LEQLIADGAIGAIATNAPVEDEAVGVVGVVDDEAIEVIGTFDC